MKTSLAPLSKGILYPVLLVAALLCAPFFSQAQNTVLSFTAPEAAAHVQAVQAITDGDVQQIFLSGSNQYGSTADSVEVVSAELTNHVAQLSGLNIQQAAVKVIRLQAAANQNISGLQLDAATLAPFTGLQYLLIGSYQALSQAQVSQLCAQLPATSNLVILYQQLVDQ